ncbi:MAG: CAP domain-containing protein [bacterium]|jgi:uncharacterized membrane protein YhhN
MALASKPKKRLAHHKKIKAHHHEHNKHYLKHYWPYLPMVLVVAFGIFINSLWTNVGVLGMSTNYSNSALLAATNANRLANSQAELTINNDLTSAAQAKAEDMVKRDYWAHIAPDGKTPWAFINESGYKYKAAGENLAFGFNSSEQAVAGWMNSPSHRENMLKPDYREVGFGIAYSQNFQNKGPETIVVAEYGEPYNASEIPITNIPTSNLQTSNTSTSAPNLDELQQPVSRIAVLTNGKAQWATIALSATIGACMMFLLLKFGLKLRRLVLEGEHFVLNHPVLDIAIVTLIVVGVILTRSSGFIY